MITLYTFAISHYAEKARWALDHKRVEYRERVLLPGPHMLTMRRLKCSATCVPVLDEDGARVQGSSAILDHADRKWPGAPLMPDDPELAKQAIELERWLDEEVGAAGRRVIYNAALPHRELVTPLFTQRGPWWGKLFYRVGYGKVADAIRGMYKIDPDTAAADAERVLAAYQRLDAMLADRRYLLGDRFSRADLTLAALSAPIWHPPEHPTRFPDPARFPEPIQRLRDRLATYRVRDYVLRMYREHRSRAAA